MAAFTRTERRQAKLLRRARTLTHNHTVVALSYSALLLAEMQADLSRAFGVATLPAGATCGLRHVPPEGRTFMGPNVYATPPGSYTWFHQDGSGTVDSGHQSLGGLNEVIMFRRMPELAKQGV